jgi:nitroimidazol reductase NimA-like FMN-containing flavoprotein (pyridoxamine 5'-phosphate oxidase superfamily)
MREDIKALICNNSHCVLATVSGTKPHCSLMSYAADEYCTELYMMTLRDSQKYSNLLHNPSVSLLIDTREEDTGDQRSRTKALTINGVFKRIDDRGTKDAIRAQLIAANPHIKEIADHPDAEPICIQIESVLLLDGVVESYFEVIGSSAGSSRAPHG